MGAGEEDWGWVVMFIELRCTYSQNGGVIRNPRGFGLCVLLLFLAGDTNVLHITSTENDVFIDTSRRSDLLGGVSPTTLGAK
jgi:hypothetical protein